MSAAVEEIAELRNIALIEEYKMLLGNRESLKKEKLVVLQLAMTGSGLIYAWVLTYSGVNRLSHMAFLIPPLLFYIAIRMSIGIQKRLRKNIEYLKMVEGNIYGETPFGITRYQSELDDERPVSLGSFRILAVLFAISVLLFAYAATAQAKWPASLFSNPTVGSTS